jgi:serine/threonine-protein kinase RsbW
MKMTVLVRDDDITHVVLDGRLDTTGAEEIEAEFTAATVGRNRPTLVDLSGMDFLASRGIGLLVSAGKRLMKAGRKMILVSPKGLVDSVLKTSLIDRTVPVVSSLAEAAATIRGEATPSAGPGAAESPRSQPAWTAAESIPGRCELSIRNQIAELKDLSAAVREFLEGHRVPYRPAYAVNLSIDELVTNVIRYAYVDDDPHQIDLELVIADGQVVLRIVDDGRPFDPRTGPELDQHAEQRELGGLGIVLVLDMVDRLNYRRADEKNCVEVRVNLAAEPAPADADATAN